MTSSSGLDLALYHPQIPQNTGTLLRLASCLGIGINLIRPFGFIFDDKRLKRAGMDYINSANFRIFDSFDGFCENFKDKRLIALVCNSSVAHNKFSYESNDILITGSEHYGFLKKDIDRIPHHVTIPMLPHGRSINMAISTAMVLSEAMSQLNTYPPLTLGNN
ncbi:MAG: tRNA methyltransferase [Holosporaceae bacterium]|jgi:tRNA (cytidine/uridine-2'-O-)-methyltransferase|nr:tRNA methyltransferase [Holosporaceae bacterium]